MSIMLLALLVFPQDPTDTDAAAAAATRIDQAIEMLLTGKPYQGRAALMEEDVDDVIPVLVMRILRAQPAASETARFFAYEVIAYRGGPNRRDCFDLLVEGLNDPMAGHTCLRALGRARGEFVEEAGQAVASVIQRAHEEGLWREEPERSLEATIAVTRLNYGFAAMERLFAAGYRNRELRELALVLMQEMPTDSAVLPLMFVFGHGSTDDELVATLEEMSEKEGGLEARDIACVWVRMTSYDRPGESPSLELIGLAEELALDGLKSTDVEARKSALNLSCRLDDRGT